VAGDRTKAHKERARKTKGKWVMGYLQGEHNLSFLCIVLSQEDGCPRVREVYR